MATVNQIEISKQLKNSGTLDSNLLKLRNRILSIGIVAGIFWSLLILMLAIAVAVWLDLFWELPAWARVSSVQIAAGLALACFAIGCWRTIRKTDRHQMARRMDVAGRTGGKIIAGLELSESVRPASSPIGHGLRTLAIEQAYRTSDTIEKSNVVPTRPMLNALICVAGLLISAGVASWVLPDLASTQWNRFVHPAEDAAPYSLIRFDVQPGNTEVVYGSDLEIFAELSESTADDVELVLVDSSGGQQTVPMFSKNENRWRSILARVDAPADYFVRSGRARSERYSIELILVPEIQKVTARLTPPEYTGLKTESGPLSATGISGLAGTQVQISVESNRPLSAGQMTVSYENRKNKIELRPAIEQENIVAGSFDIEGNGKFELHVTDVSGLNSNQVISGAIVMLSDHRPFVRILEPKPFSLATPYARLPIAIDAEDDYGISRLELFRSLNDSRPIPRTLEVTENSVRFAAREFLPLAKYQLEPGDQIKLFARVEDNDPAGVKGSESPVHVVQIISEEQFQQMQRRQQGIEAVLAKYRQINRQLEALDNLAKELEEQAEGPLDKENKIGDQLKEAAERFREEANAMKKLVDGQPQVDFDKEMSERIKELADKLEKFADELRELADQLEQGKISAEQFKKQLQQMKARLGIERKNFGEQVMQPLDGLAKAFPLIALESGFVQLVLRQRNLAERLRSFDGKDNIDDPAIKRRMRELADEQNQLYGQLDDILSEIEEKAILLPQNGGFDELRQTALEFVIAVEESEAFFEMEEAEFGLGEFSGTRGFKHADLAATILEKFLAKCSAMGNAGNKACRKCFNPSLGCPNLGDSISQLLEMFGKGGQGLGSAGNGYSQRRSTAQNIGLYGSLPIASTTRTGQGRGDQQGIPAAGPGFMNQLQAGSAEISTSAGTTGGSDISVPIKYKSKTGEYFRRIVEESASPN